MKPTRCTVMSFDREVELGTVQDAAAEPNLPVVITGPRPAALSLAAAIHRLSWRREGPLLLLVLRDAGSISPEVQARFRDLLARSASSDASDYPEDMARIIVTVSDLPDGTPANGAGDVLFDGVRFIHIVLPSGV
jgi:hypothetical protein